MPMNTYQYAVTTTGPVEIGVAENGIERQLAFTVPSGVSIYIGGSAVSSTTGYRMDGPGGTDTSARTHGPFRIPQGVKVYAVSSVATTAFVLESKFL